MKRIDIHSLDKVSGGVWPAFWAGYALGTAAAELYNKLNQK
ncbi:hypothetical protein [uncultured Rheinheimera sp.]|nr:hypothetical protein [uncultured Rheinheimera sp.]